MSYPSNIPALRNAIFDYFPNVPACEDAFAQAQGEASPVTMIVGTFGALKDHAADLDDQGREIVTGCAALIAKNQWHGIADEALAVFAAVSPTLPPPPDADEMADAP